MLNTLAIVAAEAGEPAISPYAVGAVALVILFGMLFAVVAFGGGREHS